MAGAGLKPTHELRIWVVEYKWLLRTNSLPANLKGFKFWQYAILSQDHWALSVYFGPMWTALPGVVQCTICEAIWPNPAYPS